MVDVGGCMTFLTNTAESGKEYSKVNWRKSYIKTSYCVAYMYRPQTGIIQLDIISYPLGLLYFVFKHLYSAPQHSWTNRGAFGSISSKKRDKF